MAAAMGAAMAVVVAATMVPGAAGRLASLAPAARLALAAWLAPAVMADAVDAAAAGCVRHSAMARLAAARLAAATVALTGL